MNVDQEILHSWANEIGCFMGSLPTEYLGMSLGVRHNSIKLWEPILKKLSTKLVSWKSQLLSLGGRICLVKSVLSSLSIFFMSLLRLPAAITKRITGLVSNFLWGGAIDKKTDSLGVSYVNECGGLTLKMKAWGRKLYNVSIIGLVRLSSLPRYRGSHLGYGKVEAFMWLILHERVPVKVELLKRGVSGLRMTYAISVIKRGRLLNICSKLTKDTIWLLIPCATVWTLLLHRNDIIFQGKSCDFVQLAFNIKFQAVWWWKAIKSESSILMDSIISDPSLASSIGEAYPLSRAYWCWSPPPSGFLKFNVDEACSHEGKCGVGGVLRDENGSTLMEFSLSIGYGSALMAEIVAIKFAVERFTSSQWANRSRLVVESDSKTSVDWVLNPSLASPLFSKLVQGISPFFIEGR
ncbi:hypothetical protein V6N11_075967 [Hibiscus sabdariffa]|uniref:RNase H type-1 domain-containing protein n=1 Tax=Hibiscus sabdariffa TaxID=183260 RepID=A0ABR2Q4U5_9ROSI